MTRRGAGVFSGSYLGWLVSIVGMSSRFYQLVIDSHDPHAPGLCFRRVPEGKTIKNRLHIDLNPDDRDTEVARLLALGATQPGRVDRPSRA